MKFTNYRYIVEIGNELKFEVISNNATEKERETRRIAKEKNLGTDCIERLETGQRG